MSDFTPDQAARYAAIEAADHAPESLRERVAVALYRACGEDEVSTWEQAGRNLQREMRDLADAALAVIRGEQ